MKNNNNGVKFIHLRSAWYVRLITALEYAYYFISSDNVPFELNIPLCLLVPHLWEVHLKHYESNIL